MAITIYITKVIFWQLFFLHYIIIVIIIIVQSHKRKNSFCRLSFSQPLRNNSLVIYYLRQHAHCIVTTIKKRKNERRWEQALFVNCHLMLGCSSSNWLKTKHKLAHLKAKYKMILLHWFPWEWSLSRYSWSISNILLRENPWLWSVSLYFPLASLSVSLLKQQQSQWWTLCLLLT